MLQQKNREKQLQISLDINLKLRSFSLWLLDYRREVVQGYIVAYEEAFN